MTVLPQIALILGYAIMVIGGVCLTILVVGWLSVQALEFVWRYTGYAKTIKKALNLYIADKNKERGN